MKSINDPVTPDPIIDVVKLLSDREMHEFPARWAEKEVGMEEIRRFLFLAEHYLIRAGFDVERVAHMGMEIRCALLKQPQEQT